MIYPKKPHFKILPEDNNLFVPPVNKYHCPLYLESLSLIEPPMTEFLRTLRVAYRLRRKFRLCGIGISGYLHITVLLESTRQI